MNKLQGYVIRETLKAFILAFLGLLLIMMLAFCVQFLREGLDVVRLWALPWHMLTASVPLVLPWAFLAAVIMGFGRLSADNEIMAMRTAGVHLAAVIYPVCVLALALSVLTAYLHFQVAPRARMKLELMKYSALRQMLMDNLKLSAHRRFRFYNYDVQYRDFRDGRMIDVFILEIGPSGRPETIITAASGTVIPDPDRPGYILLRLGDAEQTELGQEAYGRRGPLSAEVISVRWRFAPELERIAAKAKYQPVQELLARLRKLKRQVSGTTGRIYPGLREEIKVRRRHVTSLRVEISDGEAILSQRRKNLDKLHERTSRARRFIELQESERWLADKEIELLEDQQVSLVKQIRKLQEGPNAGDSHERITQKQRDLQAVRLQLEAQRDRKAEARTAAEEAERSIAADASDTRRISGEMQELEVARGDLVQQVEEALEPLRSIDRQQDLLALRIRIHKNLAQSVAVFVFAMIGIPLGIMTKRRSIVAAVGISFAIVLLLFYPCLIVGEAMAEVALAPVGIAMWGGNAIALLIGTLLNLSVIRT